MMKKLSKLVSAPLVSFLLPLALYRFWPEHARALDPTARVDRVLVLKSRHELTLFHDDQPLKTYRVSLGRGPSAPKSREGDHPTPEGRYILDYRNPGSRFHRSIHVSYPNAADIERARQLGAAPGGAIMVHGLPEVLHWLGKLQRLVDWTDGCIAVTNEEMDEIWRRVPDGTPIEIK